MKLSKPKNIIFTLIVFLYVLQFFVYNTNSKKLYFPEDIHNFKETSWKYSFILPLLIFIPISIYVVRKKMINKRFIFYGILMFFVNCFFFKNLTDNLLLYLNTKINVENYTKNYIVVRHDQNKVFHIYDNKNEFISFSNELSKINIIRLKNNVKSLYELQYKDTLNVNYKVGFLKVKFLP